MKRMVYMAVLIMGITACSTNNSEMAQDPLANPTEVKEGNPIITHKYTADPAALVHQDTVFLYVGHDNPPKRFNHYSMPEWLIFYSTDMVNWTEVEQAYDVKELFEWAAHSAWAAHTIEKDGKFYWYVTVTHGSIPGKAIGIAVADNPKGPFKDALGKALITNDMTEAPFQIPAGEGKMKDMDWDDIDPAVFIDDDGQAYIFWGNTNCYYAKLKDNMIELDGPIMKIELPNYTEAPWVHKKGEYYYLSYAYQFPEKTAYAMSKSINGPWVFKGLLNESAGNSNTNHQAIIDFKGKSYFIYHNGTIPTDGGSYRRSVCIDYLYYNTDGTIKKIIMTTEGIDPVE